MNPQALFFDHNQLTGTLPTELGLLDNIFDLGNGFSFRGPTGFFAGNNNLVGTIPSELGLLSGLIALSLAQNRLTGTIPKELGLLPGGEGWGVFLLVLCENALTGTIAPEFAAQAAAGILAHFNVSYNNLSGSIPEELCFLAESACSWTYPDTFETVPCVFDHDCTDILCGCNCTCSLNVTTATVAPVISTVTNQPSVTATTNPIPIAAANQPSPDLAIETQTPTMQPSSLPEGSITVGPESTEAPTEPPNVGEPVVWIGTHPPIA